MRVLVAQSAGFCMGVRRAVDRARQIADGATAPVHTDGPLIHNRQMMDQLRTEGIRECAHPESLTDGTLLIRAHGISPERRAALQRLPVCLEDATCPDVAKIQGLIRRHARRGFHVVILGDPGHAEVVGLLGYAEGRGHVVTGPADVDALPDMDPVCLVSQSTQFPETFAAVAEAIRRRYHTALVLDTICESTRNRQAELVRLAAEVDAFIVVGGVHSANTLRLVELAASLRPTLHIETADQLDRAALAPFRSVGLTAGASTPSFIIEAVRRALEALPG